MGGGRGAGGGSVGARATTLPDLVPPMQPAPGRLPDDGDWVVEFAWEGLRCVAHVRPDRLTLRTANGRDVTASFPELAEPLTRRAPREGMVLDGTIVAMGEGGLPRRSRLQRRTATARPSPAVVRRTPAGLIVGDLIWLGGHDAVALPYRRRRELLEGLGLARPPVVVAPSFPITEAEAVMRTAEEYGAEALHARHLDAPYRPGRRSRAWLRVPLRRSGLVVVGGWNPADPRRPDSVGALLLGVPGDGGLHYVGRVGVAGEEQREIGALLARWRRADPPFAVGPPAPVAAEAQWVAPELHGRVEFADWTADGRLRLPVWRGRVAGRSGGSVGGPGGHPEGGAAAVARWVRPPGSPDPAPSGIPRQAAGPAVPPTIPTQEPGDPVPAVDPADGGYAAPDTPAAGVPAAVEARRLEQHFVYNSLNTIASLMRSDPVRARELLLGFADLTRAADRPEGVPGTLGDELAAVRAYLQLEQARFGRRLQVEIVVDEGLHALPMAPRRVLDAVRAVVQQRIEPRPDGGTLTVTAERAGAGCLVRVAERDGAGHGGEPTLVAPS
ncbi:MAG: bifunctional non-ous end joining protein LigD [Pseudonocardiales bacterium]|nr:bifunctional non-ous end joining protein LigD [Pseudonocardiales bacterium]